MKEKWEPAFVVHSDDVPPTRLLVGLPPTPAEMLPRDLRDEPPMAGTAREGLKLYVWGENAARAGSLYAINGFAEMISEIPASRPSWGLIVAWMEPTSGGRVPDARNVKRAVRSALDRYGIGLDNVVEALIWALERTEERLATVDGPGWDAFINAIFES